MHACEGYIYLIKTTNKDMTLVMTTSVAY